MAWWRVAFVGSLGLLVACGTLLGIEPDTTPAAADAGPEAGPSDASTSPEGSSDSAAEAALMGGPCNLAAPFGEPAVIVTSANGNASATLSEDELTIFVDTLVQLSRRAIFVSTRAALTAPFPAGMEITGPVSSPSSETYNAALSQDGLGLVFVSNRSGPGEHILYEATRPTTASDFQNPRILNTIGAMPAAVDLQPFVTTDGDLWFISDRRTPGVQFDIFRSALLPGGIYGTPALAPGGDLTSNNNETKAVLTHDGLRIFFGSERGSVGNANIWTATRSNKSADFGTATLVAELNSTGNDRPAWISPDSCRLYLSSDRIIMKDQIYVASRPLK